MIRWIIDEYLGGFWIDYHQAHTKLNSISSIRPLNHLRWDLGMRRTLLIQKRVFLQIPSGNQPWLAGEIPKNGAVNGENKWTWHIYDINVVFSSKLWWHPSGVSATTMENWVPLGPHLDDPSLGGKRGERLGQAFRHQIRETKPLIMEIVGSLYPYHIQIYTNDPTIDWHKILLSI